MKKTNFLKLATVAVLSTGLMVGCASESTETPAPEAETKAKDCPTAAAKNAIYAAKIKLARAEKLGYAWTKTGDMLKEAEKAAAACDSDKAIKLANQAGEQADDAIAQHDAETKRFEENQGSVEGEATTESSEYTVASGDNLWTISGQDAVYGNPYQWPIIYKANSDQIKDADLIFSGQVFTIPTASAAEVDAAVQHAKTRGAWSIGETEASDSDYLAQ